MRLSLRDHFGHELDRAEASDGFSAVSHAMRILSRRERLDPGDMLAVTNGTADDQAAGPTMQIRASHLRSICDRLDACALAVEDAQPEHAADLRTVARFCRHAIRVGWIVTSVAVA